MVGFGPHFTKDFAFKVLLSSKIGIEVWGLKSLGRQKMKNFPLHSK